MPPSGHRIISSLPLQVLMYFNAWYAFIFYILNYVLFIYKSLALPYPQNYLGGEVAGIVLMMLLEMTRLPLGYRGNKTEQSAPTLLFCLLTIGLGVGCAYFVALQTFVLFVDLILNGIYFVFLGLEIVLALFAAFSFYRNVSV
jgi:hypothetical protein